MDSSYLAQQVSNIVGQLHGLFDEIGVPNHERETREAELFSALSETLHSQVRIVTMEKKNMVEEAQRMITSIRQMEASLDDGASPREYQDDDLVITFPLSRCLQLLKEKHVQICRLHKERFEQVKKLVEALESYACHLEPTFVKLDLPPTDIQSIPPSFDLSPSYVDRLDNEFTRVYEEYMRRVATVQALGDHIIQLWAELSTPQAQTDPAIVRHYRDAPEQLGLHEEDIARLRSRRDKLSNEKKAREKKLQDLRAAVDALWLKLGVDESERKAFLNANRGCGVRQINEFEDELRRLNELKRQNLHLFVEDARCKLQELWDALYLSEDEMLEFTPAFSDVYSDALLEAHEREVGRLEVLREQRASLLTLIDRHKSLVQERDELAVSSQDGSRLTLRGQKGEKRDPGKLLREEKMRKRIAKDLPKIATELQKTLEAWEDEYGRPYLVHGDRYLDVIDADNANASAIASAKAAGPRSKTPAGPPPTPLAPPPPPPPPPSQQSNSRNHKSSTHGRANSTTKVPPSRSLTKSPTGHSQPKRQPVTAGQAQPQGTAANTKGSPSRIPARAPLASLKNGSNSPERHRQEQQPPLRQGPPLMRAPPPKMRDLIPVPEFETPMNTYVAVGLSSSIVRAVEPEDVYDDRARGIAQHQRLKPTQHQHQPQYHHHHHHANEENADDGYGYTKQYHPQAPPPPRQMSDGSHTSHATTVSGSENWETYDDNSEPEPDASDTYYAKVRAARGKRAAQQGQEQDHDQERGREQEKQNYHYGDGRGHKRDASPSNAAAAAKWYRGLPPPSHSGQAAVTVDENGNRIISGSEWTDED